MQIENPKRCFDHAKEVPKSYISNQSNLDIDLQGDDLLPENSLLFSNHQSLGDHVVMHHLAQRANANASALTLPTVNFFLWFHLWRVPTLRLLVNLAKSDENWDLDEAACTHIFSKVMQRSSPQWVVLFPEVNVWTGRDSEILKRQSERYFLPQFDHVLYPRYSTFFNAMAGIRYKGNVGSLYDVTILYHKQKEESGTLRYPTLLDIFCDEPVKVSVRVKKRVLSRISSRSRMMERWLEHTWAEKNALIEKMRVNLEHTEEER